MLPVIEYVSPYPGPSLPYALLTPAPTSGPNAGGLAKLYRSQPRRPVKLSLLLAFQLPLVSSLWRVSAMGPAAKKLLVTPARFGCGRSWRILSEIGSMRLVGTRLPAKVVRPLPSATPVSGS